MTPIRVVTPRHIADRVQDWTVREGKRDVKVSRHNALAVLDALWECNKRNQGHVFPTGATIAERMGISRNTVTRTLTALEAQGLIRALGPRNGGRGRPTVWGLVENPGNDPVDYDVNLPTVGRFTGDKPPHGGKKPPHGGTQTSPRWEETSPRWGTHGREKEERKEERKKMEPTLTLVDPPEPPRACRMPDCEHPAIVGSRCIRHAAGLPFPPPPPADGLPVVPERQQETA